MNKIEIRDVVKTYDGKKNILEGISLDVREGEFFILVGPSGCGKSTLLRIIAGLEKISSGTLMLDGKIANEMPPKDRNLSTVSYTHLDVYKRQSCACLKKVLSLQRTTSGNSPEASITFIFCLYASVVVSAENATSRSMFSFSLMRRDQTLSS